MREENKAKIKQAAKDTVALYSTRWWAGFVVMCGGVIRAIPIDMAPAVVVFMEQWIDGLTGGLPANMLIMGGIALIGMKPILRIARGGNQNDV